MDANTIGTLLTDLLVTCADAFTIIPGAPTAPARQFVSFGEPNSYIEGNGQLVVWTTGIRLVNPFPLTKSSADFAAVMPATDLMVQILRPCWPGPSVTTPASSQLPKPAAIQAAALAADADGATLYAHLSNLAVKGGMFPTLPTIRDNDIALSPMTPIGPAGVHVGWRCTVAVKLAI
jgi:hypothetical protein